MDELVRKIRCGDWVVERGFAPCATLEKVGFLVGVWRINGMKLEMIHEHE
jgi:hypothetical protein